MLSEIIVLALLLLFVLYYWQMLWSRRTLPPGPFPWPLFGNVFQLEPNKPHETCLKWSKTYGPVFTMWMGMEPTIIITDYELIKDALHGDQLISRPKIYVNEQFSKGNFGIIMSTGELFKEQKKFCLQILKNFGLGRNLMQENILAEAAQLVRSIRAEMGTATEIVLDLSTSIQLCVGGIISSMLFGHSFEKDDQRFKLMIDTLDEYFKLLGSLRILLLNSFPWLRHVPLFGRFGMDDLRKSDNIFRNFFTEEVENHKRELEKKKNDDEEAKDFLIAYLKEIKRRQQSGEEMSHFSEWQLTCIVSDLWIPAVKDTTTTFRWAILAMIKYPHAQQKAFDEIDAVLGRDKLPTMADRQSMPYVAATVNEILRWSNITNFNVYHSNDTDFRLGGYTIPKGTHVIPQIACCAIDEKIFPRPEQFRPERFLEEDGKTLRKVEQMAPFSMGKRACVGESLARAELFLILVHLLQKFQFSVCPGQDEPSAESIVAIASAPRDFDCFVTLR